MQKQDSSVGRPYSQPQVIQYHPMPSISQPGAIQGGQIRHAPPRYFQAQPLQTPRGIQQVGMPQQGPMSYQSTPVFNPAQQFVQSGQHVRPGMVNVMQVQRQQMPVTGAPQFVDGGQYTPNVVPVQFLNNTAQPVIYIQHQPVSNAMQYRGQNPPVYQPPQSATTQAQMTPTNQPQPTHQQQPPPQSHQPAPPQQYEKKRSSRIVIKDPESGRDVTDVILKKKESKAQANTQSNFTYAAPLPQGPDDTKAKEIRAQFAQQVAARLLPEKPTPVNQPPVKIENRKTEPPVAIATPELAIVKTEKPTQNGNINVQKINEPIVNQKPPVIIKKEPGETDTSVIAREKAELDPKSETSVPVVVSHNKKILQPKEKVNTEDKSKQQVSQKPIVPAQENKTEELENIDSVEKEIGLEKPGKDPVEVNTVIEETRKDEPTKNIKNIETKSSLTAEVIKEKVVEISEKLKELPQEAPVESKESELNKELPIESKNLPNESSLETKKSDKIESLVESKVHLKELPAEEKGLPKESPVVTKESSKEAPVLSKPLTKEATAESKGSSKENSEKPMKVDAGKQSLPSADVPAKEISSVDPSAQDAKKDPSAEKVAAQEPAKAKPADSTNTEDAVKAADSSSVNGSVNVVEETVTEVKEDVISSSPVVNGYDSNPGGSAFNPVPKKKKQKQRLKEMSAKGEKADSDLMSAFVDKPPKVQESSEKEESKEEAAEVPPEEETWEDKESKLDEELKNKQNEIKDELVPKTADTKIIDSEQEEEISADSKRQYDRDFLLKFQFAPICTEKPDGLPDIEIVLDKAHDPTKPLAPGQRIQPTFDFMPSFMRQHSGGGRQMGMNRVKGGGRMPPQPKKIIQVQPAKVELKKSENAWVRPGDKAKELPEEERAKEELYRKVRGILNKLTPQKFQTLVEQMMALEIDSQEKLDNVIDLVFQKAISEPAFSVAYANMCKVLSSQLKIPVEGKEGAFVTFRRVLLNKCQKEFEKEKDAEKSLEKEIKEKKFTSSKPVEGKEGAFVTFRRVLLNKCQKEFEKEKDAEKSLEKEIKEKKFTSEEEEVAWRAEFEERELKARRRSLGNIRFIGELFKLKMLTEAIMHDCVIKLLKASDAESIECLCKLVTTIGKDLDHPKAKPRMDQYFQQMVKIIRGKKVSSRTRFMLQDVVDLRENNWVPRRDDSGPKTIDQIHKEAKLQEQQIELNLQKAARAKRLGGGRDSPGGPGGPRGPPSTEEGWNQVVSTKGSRTMQTVDPSKLKVTKRTDSENISLGPGGRPGAWAQGASGGASARSAARSTESGEQSQGNRFSALSEHGARGSTDGKGRLLGPARQQQMGGRRSSAPIGPPRRPGDERAGALAAARNLSQKKPRTPSPLTTPVRQEEVESKPEPKLPSSADRTATISPAQSSGMTREKMEANTKATLDEFCLLNDMKEAIQCVKDFKAPDLHDVFISETINFIAEAKSSENRRKIGQFIRELIVSEVVSVSSVLKGLDSILEFAEDIAIDIPHFWNYLGEFFGPVVYDGTLPLNKLKESIEPLMQCNKAGFLMAEILSAAVRLSSEEQIAELWQRFGMTWDNLLKSPEEISNFVKDKKLEFTVVASPKSGWFSHASQIQQELRRIIQSNKDKSNKDQIIEWIQTNVPSSQRSESSFIRSLTTAVCQVSIKEDKPGCSCDAEVLKPHKNLLMRYIDSDRNRELEALFAVQHLANELNHPQGVLRAIFEALYDEEIVSDDSIFTWETSEEEPQGKGVALSSIHGFLQWLREAEEETAPE